MENTKLGNDYLSEAQTQLKKLIHTPSFRMIFDGEPRILFRGFLTGMSEKIKSHVVFNEIIDKSNNSNKRVALTTYDKIYFQQYSCSLCAGFRSGDYYNNDNQKCQLLDNKGNPMSKEHLCNSQDDEMTDVLNSAIREGIALPLGIEKHHEYKSGDISITIYRYFCKYTRLAEWIIPIYLNYDCCGVILTGQLKHITWEPPTCDEIEADSKSYEELINKIQISDEPEIGSSDMNEFAQLVAQLQRYINDSYETKCRQTERIVQEELLNKIWGRDNVYPKARTLRFREIHDMLDRYRFVRTNLFDSAILLREIFQLDEIAVFKPRAGSEGFGQNQHIYGADLTEADIITKNTSLEYDRKFKEMPHLTINVKKLYDINENQDNYMILRTVSDDCKQYFSGNSLSEIDWERRSLIIYALREHETFSVGYFFRQKKDICKERVDFRRNLLLRFFERFSPPFLVQWAMVSSEHLEVAKESNHEYILHELGQFISGWHMINRRFERLLIPTIKPGARDLRNTYPFLPEDIVALLDYCPDYLKDQQAYNALIDNISINLGDFTSDKAKIVLKLEEFWPFDRILFKLIANYKFEAERISRKIIAPSFEILSPSDKLRPKLYADPSALEQALNCLYRNALRYSYKFTKIHVDAMLNTELGKPRYEFKVTSYGAEILETEQKLIFELGYRGKRHIHGLAGSGFGLFIAKRIANAHNGDIYLKESKLISNVNIPLIERYLKMDEGSRYFNKDLKNKCKTEYEHLKYNKIYNDVVYKNSENPDKLEEKSCKNYINNKIYQNTFIIWIPIIGGKS